MENKVQYEVTETAKAADGREILIEGKQYEDEIYQVDGQSHHFRMSFKERESGLAIGHVSFPRQEESVIKLEVENAVVSIDEYLKCL